MDVSKDHLYVTEPDGTTWATELEKKTGSNCSMRRRMSKEVNMSQLIAGIDLGTTALKIAIFDTTGKMLGNATLEYTLYTPQSYFVESDPAVYMDAMKRDSRFSVKKKESR